MDRRSKCAILPTIRTGQCSGHVSNGIFQRHKYKSTFFLCALILVLLVTLISDSNFERSWARAVSESCQNASVPRENNRLVKTQTPWPWGSKITLLQTSFPVLEWGWVYFKFDDRCGEIWNFIHSFIHSNKLRVYAVLLQNHFFVIYTVLLRKLFCRNLRAITWRKLCQKLCLWRKYQVCLPG